MSSEHAAKRTKLAVSLADLMIETRRMTDIIPYFLLSLEIPTPIIDALIQNAPLLFVLPLFRALTRQCQSIVEKCSTEQRFAKFSRDTSHLGDFVVERIHIPGLRMKCRAGYETITFTLETWGYEEPLYVISEGGLHFLNGKKIPVEQAQVYLPVKTFVAQIRESVNDVLYDVEEQVRLSKLEETEVDRVMEALGCLYGNEELVLWDKRREINFGLAINRTPHGTLLKILLHLEQNSSKSITL